MTAMQILRSSNLKANGPYEGNTHLSAKGIYEVQRALKSMKYT